MTSTWAHPRRPSWPQFLAWTPVGAAVLLVPIAAFTPLGPLAMLPAAGFALLALRLGGANVSGLGTAAGAGLWGFVLAGLDYPDVAVAGPALAVGVALVASSTGAFAVARGRRR